MKRPLFFAGILLVMSCNDKPSDAAAYPKGSFGYDLAFLGNYDSLVVLAGADSSAQVIVSPRYQGKVFTSTAAGRQGKSFGWIHYSAFDAPVDPHMNAYGGENRLWLGPEGGNYSLFFPQGKPQIFDNWKTPAAFDTESWKLVNRTKNWVLLQKDMRLQNYRGHTLSLTIRRDVRLMDAKEIADKLGVKQNNIQAVGYETGNTLINTGLDAWSDTTGIPCLWVLDMFPPSPHTTIVIPYDNAIKKPANTGYFGEIAKERIKLDSSMLYFKADGAARGKLGITPAAAKNIAGSYDADSHILTIAWFSIDSKAAYLNQEWGTVKGPFTGDAVNAYNDGPLADGKQMGPFYELESVSRAAKLAPGQSLMHKHAVVHVMGNESDLNTITQKLFGVPVEKIGRAFQQKQ